MLRHSFYQKHNFLDKFLLELKNKFEKETAENPLLRALASRRENAEEKAKREKEKEKEREKDKDRERKDKKLKKVWQAMFELKEVVSFQVWVDESLFFANFCLFVGHWY